MPRAGTSAAGPRAFWHAFRAGQRHFCATVGYFSAKVINFIDIYRPATPSFYADFDKGGVDFIKQKLDIKQDNVVSIRAENIYATLQSARAELYEYIDYIDLRETQKVMNICISKIRFRVNIFIPA